MMTRRHSTKPNLLWCCTMYRTVNARHHTTDMPCVQFSMASKISVPTVKINRAGETVSTQVNHELGDRLLANLRRQYSVPMSTVTMQVVQDVLMRETVSFVTAPPGVHWTHPRTVMYAKNMAVKALTMMAPGLLDVSRLGRQALQVSEGLLRGAQLELGKAQSKSGAVDELLT